MADSGDYGLIPDSSTPQDLEGFVAHAMSLGERAHFEAGRFVADGPINEANLPNGVPMHVVGEGSGSSNSQAAITSLVFPEMGAGVKAMDPSTGAYEGYIADLAIVGPTRAANWGQFPADMDGIFIDTKVTVERVNVQGFRSNIQLGADHVTLRGVNSNGGGYNLDFPANLTGGMGDLKFYDCNFEGGKLASVGVSSQAMVANAVFSGCHIGFCPLHFERYDTAVTNQFGFPLPRRGFLDWVTFLHTSFEAGSHGQFLDNTPQQDGALSNVYFFPAAQSGGLGNNFVRPGLPQRATIDVPKLNNLWWWAKPPLWDLSHPAIRCKEANGIFALPDYDGAMSTVVNGNGPLPIQLLPGSTDSVPLRAIHWGALPGSHVGAIQVRKATESLQQFDLVQYDGYGNVKRNNQGMAGDVAGICGRSVTAGQACHYIVQAATAAGKCNNYGPAIPNWSLIGPDPDHPGGIRAVTNVKDSIGRAVEAIASGAAGRVDLTGIRYDIAPQAPSGFEELVFGPGRKGTVEADGLHMLPEEFV